MALLFLQHNQSPQVADGILQGPVTKIHVLAMRPDGRLPAWLDRSAQCGMRSDQVADRGAAFTRLRTRARDATTLSKTDARNVVDACADASVRKV